MPSLKAIKRRIASVSNTQQIMKAMNMVAASKVQKNKSRMDGIKPLLDEAREFLDKGVSVEGAFESIYYTSRPAKNVGYVVISGERGLCGSYNANILKAALAHMDDTGKNTQLITIGTKSKEFFTRQKKHIAKEYSGMLDNVSYSAAEEIVSQLAEMFTAEAEEERLDEIYIAYTQFETLLSHTPTITKLLPFKPVNSDSHNTVIYEPDIHTYLKRAVPIYLTMFIYGAMVESAVCEQTSRMISMDAAARNAGEIVDDLTLQYNRQRQSVITQEISEIVGGSNVI